MIISFLRHCRRFFFTRKFFFVEYPGKKLISFYNKFVIFQNKRLVKNYTSHGRSICMQINPTNLSGTGWFSSGVTTNIEFVIFSGKSGDLTSDPSAVMITYVDTM